MRLSTIKVIEVAMKTVVFLRRTMIQMNTVRKNKKYCQWNKEHMQLFIHAMQKVEDEKASCKHSSGNFFIMEDNDLSQSLDRVWNFKCPSSLHESNTLPGKYMTPKIEKHFKTNRELILVMRTIGKWHSENSDFNISSSIDVLASLHTIAIWDFT